MQAFSSPKKKEEPIQYLSDEEEPLRRTTPNDLKRPRQTSSQEWLDTPTRANKRKMGPTDILNSPQMQQLKKLDLKTAEQLNRDAYQLVVNASLVLQRAQSKTHAEHAQKLRDLRSFYENKLELKSKDFEERMNKKEEMQKKEKENDEKTRNFQQIQMQLTTLSAEMEKRDATRSKLNEETENFKKENAKLKKENADLKRAKDSEKLKFDKIKQRNDFIDKQLKMREKDVQDKIKAYEQLEKEAKQSKIKHETEVKALRREVDDLKKSKDELKRQHDVLMEGIGGAMRRATVTGDKRSPVGNEGASASKSASGDVSVKR